MKDLLNKSLLLVKECIKYAEDNHLTDSQEFIDWEMELSNLACKEHPDYKHFGIQHL